MGPTCDKIKCKAKNSGISRFRAAYVRQKGDRRLELEFDELQATSLRELFVKQIEGMILSGKLPVGTKLPTERELSEKMKVSRAVVNGGLSDMEAKGFLQVIPRKGTYVADYKYKGKLDILKSIWNTTETSLTRTCWPPSCR